MWLLRKKTKVVVMLFVNAKHTAITSEIFSYSLNENNILFSNST